MNTSLTPFDCSKLQQAKGRNLGFFQFICLTELVHLSVFIHFTVTNRILLTCVLLGEYLMTVVRA